MQHVLERLSGVVQRGDGFKALCPAHSDLRPSLSISPGEGGRVLIHCQAGCKTEDVLREIGLKWIDLQGDGSPVDPDLKSARKSVTEGEADFRDTVYRVMIGYLGLSAEHRAALEGRGLPGP